MEGEKSFTSKNRLLVIAAVLISVIIIVPLFFYNYDVLPPSNVVVWDTIGSPDSIDPHVDYESFGAWIIYNVYETLYTYPWTSNSTDPLIPLLAADQPIISADGLNYTITLRSGITFQDGTPFNASCVKWNFERLLKIFNEYGPAWLISEPIRGGDAVKEAALSEGTSSTAFKSVFDDWVANSNAIIVLDETHIRFVLERPYSPFLKVLAHPVTSIMSPTFAIAHANNPAWTTWDEYGIDYGESDNYMAEHTCGTGPYRLTNWVLDQYVQLDQYTDYWRTSTSFGAGSIDRVYIRTNEDANGRSLNLKTGTCDGVYWSTTDILEIWDPITDESKDPYIIVSTGGISFSYTILGLNMENAIAMVNDSIIISTSPFRNVHFRRAATYSFDYNSYIEIYANGLGVPGEGPIPRGMVGHDCSAFDTGYNISAAVAEWNLAMQDPAFVSSLNAMGNVLTFYFPESSSWVRGGIFEVLKDGLETVFSHPSANHTGLTKDMEFCIEGLSWNGYFEFNRNGTLPVYAMGWAPDIADPMDFIIPTCYHTGVYAQRIHFNDTEVNAWCDAVLSEANPIQRQDYLNQIQDRLANDAPYIWIYQNREFRTWRTLLRGDGLIYNPMRDIYFYHLWKKH